MEVKYASLNRRIVAAAIDLFIMVCFITPIMSPISDLVMDKTYDVIFQEIQAQNSEELITAWMVIEKLQSEHFFQKYFTLQFITFMLMTLYVVVSWSWKGTTIGKWACACKVVDSSTYQKPSVLQAIVRWFGYILSALPFGMGFVVVAFSRTKRGWHDMLSGTCVILFQHDFTAFERWRNKLLGKH